MSLCPGVHTSHVTRDRLDTSHIGDTWSWVPAGLTLTASPSQTVTDIMWYVVMVIAAQIGSSLVTVTQSDKKHTVNGGSVTITRLQVTSLLWVRLYRDQSTVSQTRQRPVYCESGYTGYQSTVSQAIQVTSLLWVRLYRDKSTVSQAIQRPVYCESGYTGYQSTVSQAIQVTSLLC